MLRLWVRAGLTLLCMGYLGSTSAASVEPVAPALATDTLVADVQTWVDVVAASGASPALAVP